MAMFRRTQTCYVAVDSFFSPRGKVLHHFDQLLEGLSGLQVPCIWMTSWTRAQLDEPRRRLGQNDPFIGENGSGVYLPEDYFHLKGSQTVRLGRYTCIPIAKPQPAAAEALEELSEELEVEVVPLRKLSPRELSQNTGLHGREAEFLRMRDFDELFFFAGASDGEIAKFQAEASVRGLVLHKSGAFWSLSCGGNVAKCVKELGALYDRALRAHAHRVGLYVGEEKNDHWPRGAFDRTLAIARRAEREAAAKAENGDDDEAGEPAEASSPTVAGGSAEIAQRGPARLSLGLPDLWDEVLRSLAGGDVAAAMRRAQS